MDLPIGSVYQQTPRDARGTQWGPLNFRGVDGRASTTLKVGGPDTGVVSDIPWAIPKGYVAALHWVQVHVVPGGAQNFTFFLVEIRNAEDGQVIELFREPIAGGAGVARAVTISTDVLLVDDLHFLTAQATFNAGISSNQLAMSTQVILMPRANVSLF